MGLPPTQTTQVQSEATPSTIQVAKYARNGLVPHAVLETEIANALDFVAAIRGKNLFTWRVPLAAIPAANNSAGVTVTRWRFAGHTSPFTRRLRAMILTARSNVTSGTGPTATNPASSIVIEDATGSTTYGSATIYYGKSLIGVSDVPSEFASYEVRIACPADADIYGRITDTDGGRIIAVSIQEEMLPVTAANGYLVPKSVGVSTPIYDARRETALELATLLWKRAGAHLWNWTVDNQASLMTNASGTFKNLIDTSVTTVSAASPGVTLDTRYCRTLGLATVPCMWKIYAKMSGASDTGEVNLLDSTGTPVATIALSGSTAAWYSTPVNLPAALAKYDLQFSNPDFAFGGETISVGASSLYQYAA